MKKILFLLILVTFSFSTIAKTYHIIISSEQGAPRPSQIVDEASLSPPPPSFTLSAFNSANPEDVRYLIKTRATGHLRTIMDNNPNWERSLLQQYLVVVYPDGMDESMIQQSLDSDQYIASSYQIVDEDFAKLSVPYPDINKLHLKQEPKGEELKLVNKLGSNIQSAWELSEGMGYIGIADTGLQTNHPDLRAFDELDNYVGGNLLGGLYQIDFAKFNGVDLNVDEQEKIPATGSFANCDDVDGDPNDGLTYSSFVGHGTHVSGLIGAKGGLAPGICKNCGISMMKFYGAEIGSCYRQPVENDYYLLASLTSDSYLSSWEILASTGMGTVNLSAGNTFLTQDTCDLVPTRAECRILKLMEDNQVLFVGAAGNDRTTLQFPASDDRPLASGGIDEVGNFWNESPNGGDYTSNANLTNCPQRPSGWGQLGNNEECGSSFSYDEVDHRTDVVTQSRNVYSTFYQGKIHNPLYNPQCSDAFDGIPNDGYGLCTGTSMSAPQTAAILQLMRSAHPLLPNGTYDPDTLIGIRNVFNAASARPANGLNHDKFFGYGEPDARKALEIILGKSNGNQIKTRLTPMFELSSVEEKNNVYTPFSQVAVAFLTRTDSSEYLSNSSQPLVNEFPEFWYNTDDLTLSAPRASFYVFTTNNNPFVDGLKNMVPLRRMDKTIQVSNRNDTYAVSDIEIKQFYDDGYNYAGIEGYIHPTCPLEPGCIPAGMHILYRVVDDINFNHTLVNLPINNPAPSNSTKLGYVFPNVDSDSDGLIDGQERILGTLINNPDSDGDDLTDGFEYPPAGVPFSDPLISDIIFEDDFE